MSWQLLYFWRDLSEIAPNYDDCPSVCGETDETRKDFCEGCPIKEADADFVENLMEMLDKRCPGEWQKYGIDNLRRTVSEVMRLEKSNAELSITTETLISIVQSERSKMERIDRWNAEQQRRTNSNN